MLEIELKAWSDVDAARRRLEALGKPLLGTKVKEDVYYCGPGVDPATCDAQRDRVVRVRIQDGEALVTAKKKEIRDGIEQSREIELAVGSAEAFRALLDYMGYHAFIAKRKESRSYAWGDGITVELNRIGGLGEFVEIEGLLSEGSAPEAVEALRAKLLAALAAVAPDARLEPRPYALLLRDRGLGRA